jgi:hypothetical protein
MRSCAVGDTRGRNHRACATCCLRVPRERGARARHGVHGGTPRVADVRAAVARTSCGGAFRGFLGPEHPDPAAPALPLSPFGGVRVGDEIEAPRRVRGCARELARVPPPRPRGGVRELPPERVPGGPGEGARLVVGVPPAVELPRVSERAALERGAAATRRGCGPRNGPGARGPTPPRTPCPPGEGRGAPWPRPRTTTCEGPHGSGPRPKPRRRHTARGPLTRRGRYPREGTPAAPRGLRRSVPYRVHP